MDHSFNVEIAQEYDVNTALFLQHLKFWTFNNLANKRNIHDGHCWTYNTLDAFCLTFPYWTKKQIRTVIDHCVDKELIIKGNYNQTTYDRTCWYALSQKSYGFYPELKQPVFTETLNASKAAENTICPNGHMDMPEWAHRDAQMGTPIPDTKPDTKPDLKNTPSEKQTDTCFEKFWELYPVKSGKKVCVQKWRAKNLNSIADKILKKVIEQLANDDAWRRGFIPNPLTYINQERWEDEIRSLKPNIVQFKQSTYDHEDTSWIHDLSKDAL